MTKQVQRRRGTATQHTSFTGAEGELSVNTTNKSVHVHDNVTAGGFEAARADMDNVTSSSILTAAGITATTAELNYVDGVTSNIQTQLDGKAGTASPTFTGTLTTANLTATGTTTLAGASTSADITFGDNDKAIFGAGSDLQIYHDGTNSYIDEAAAGDLYIRAFDRLKLNNYSDNAAMLNAKSGAEVELYYNGGLKLATTSTGVDITGTLTSDGLTVNGNATIQQDDALIFIKETDGTNIAAVGDLTGAGQGGAFYYDHGGTATIQLKSYEASTIENGLNVKGDISFYEDTGTTPKFFWDASAESLGLGITAPEAAIHIIAPANQEPMTIEALTNGYNYITHRNAAGTDVAYTGLGGGAALVSGAVTDYGIRATGNLLLGAGSNTERMRIDSSGNVGIGTTSPSQKLEVSDTTTATVIVRVTNNDGNAEMQKHQEHLYINLNDTGNIFFRSGSTITERMRIDNSGVVIINQPAGTSDSGTVRITGGTSGLSNLQFADTADGNIGMLQYNHTSNYLLFQVNNAEAMRLDASGHLLVGTTDNAVWNDTSGTGGINLRSDGILAAARNGGEPLLLNRLGTDGELIKFNKNGTTVGSIVTNAGALVVKGASTTAPVQLQTHDGNEDIEVDPDGFIKMETAGSERLRIDSSGNLIVGDTSAGGVTSGGKFYATPSSGIYVAANADNAGYFNRNGGDGSIVEFRAGNAPVGSIGANGGDIYIGNSDVTLSFNDVADLIAPTGTNGVTRDGVINLGNGGNRFDDIYATNGTIQTSDRNEKQDIAELTDAEQRVAVTAKGLLRKFRWKSAVEAKGDEARTHFGIIAQDLQAAFAAEGLDAGDYAMFISSTWTDEETGEERTRMGVRYSELLAFIIAAI